MRRPLPLKDFLVFSRYQVLSKLCLETFVCVCVFFLSFQVVFTHIYRISFKSFAVESSSFLSLISLVHFIIGYGIIMSKLFANKVD